MELLIKHGKFSFLWESVFKIWIKIFFWEINFPFANFELCCDFWEIFGVNTFEIFWNIFEYSKEFSNRIDLSISDISGRPGLEIESNSCLGLLK
jgi:hypothetical protein